MMTSALLNMLDTPEELAAYRYGEDGEQEEGGVLVDDDQLLYYESAYPASAAAFAPPLYPRRMEAYAAAHPPPAQEDSFDPEFFERLSISRAAPSSRAASESNLAGSWSRGPPPPRTGSGGSLPLNGGGGHGRFNPGSYRGSPPFGEDAPMQQHHHHAQGGSGGGSGGGDVGLFLP
jgi:hypothetical protein